MVIPKPISKEEWEDYLKNNDFYYRSWTPVSHGYITRTNCGNNFVYQSSDSDESYIESAPFKNIEEAELNIFFYHLTEAIKLLNFEALKPSSPEQVVEIKVPGELLLYLAEQSPELADKIHDLLLQHGKEVKTQEKRLQDTISFLNSTKALTKTIISAIEIENKFLTNEVTSLTEKLKSLEAEKLEMIEKYKSVEEALSNPNNERLAVFIGYLLSENQRLQELLDLKNMST